MISHKYQCIFIHIPKCGGTSIEHALGHYPHGDSTGGQDHRGIRRIEQPFPNSNILASFSNINEAFKRVTLSYKRHRNPNNRLTLTESQYKHYYKFTVVRNPWARILSVYNVVLGWQPLKKRWGIKGDISLEDFINKFTGFNMLRTQLSYLVDFNGEVNLNHIAKLEDIENGFKIICEDLNISHINLPHRNKGPNVNYKEIYNNKSMDLVYKCYEEEIELFNYSF